MVDKRDDSVRSAGTGPGHAHITDEGADARSGDARYGRTMNDARQEGEPVEGDQPPSPIAGVEENSASAASDIPNLGDEGGGSRYGDDDARDEREDNEYSGAM